MTRAAWLARVLGGREADRILRAAERRARWSQELRAFCWGLIWALCVATIVMGLDGERRFRRAMAGAKICTETLNEKASVCDE